MKKNSIKVIFMAISALLCSHLWAQGSESVSSETTSSESARAYAKTYTISVKKESETIVQTLQLTTRNGRTEITSGMMPADGYSAFFIADDGSYYGFDYNGLLPEGQRAIWKEYKNKEQIDYVNNIYKYLLGKNCQLITEDENDLDDVSYNVIKTSDLLIIDKNNFIRTGVSDFNKLYIYNEKKGTFFLAVKENADSDEVKVVCFRDKKSKAEIIDNLNENDFKNWLNASKESKEKNVHNEEYKRLSKLIYESLKNHSGFKNLYSDNFEKFYKIYLQVALENNKNVYFSELSQNDETYKPEDYKINISANEQIKNSAQAYINVTVTEKKLFSTKTVNLSFDYKDNQSDTPDIYKLKYQKQKDNNIPDTKLSKGCDDLGFLNGILYSSFKSGEIKVKDTDSLSATYKKYEDEVKSLKKKENTYPTMNNVIQTLTEDELNKISIVIPELKYVKAGDLVFFIKKEQKHNAEDIRTKKKCAVIMVDGNNSMKIEDFQVIIMDEEKGAIQESLKNIWKTVDGFEIPEITEIRRILTVGQASNINENWNVLNENVANETIEVLCIREDFQTSSEKFRFIPNTGEYLSMEKIRLNAYNQFGIRVRGDEWKVTLNGAKDRNWEKNNQNGNVTNNTDCKFEIKIGDKIGELSKLSDSENYSITWYKDKEKKIKEEDKNIPKFEIKSKDNLLFYGSEVLEIKIRPENAAKARPGDDLLLEFKLTKPGFTDMFITLSEKDYIAVYDKKMMWRANLFLEKIESELGYLDWNDAHPWNAPADSTATQNVPSWWKNSDETVDDAAKRWGYNKWNKIYKASYTDNLGIFKTMDDLLQGDGTQVVEFPQSVFYYGMQENLPSDYSNTGFVNPYKQSYEHTIKNAVCYDYWGWDNPFSFRKKMTEQIQLMTQLSGKETINHYTDMIFPLSYGMLKTDTNKPTGVYYNGGTDFYPKFFETYKQNTTPSTNLIIRSNPVISETDTSITLHPYLSGLSDSLSYKYKKAWNHMNICNSDMVAGIDCNGLVQVSSAYEDSFYSALDKENNSRKDPVYWNYSTNEIPVSVMKHFRDKDTINSNGTVTYGNLEDNRTAVCIGTFKPDKEIKYKDDKDKTKVKTVFAYFNNIVPGDLIWYDGHIMIVSSIDLPDGYDENNKPYWNDGGAVHILESVYSKYVDSIATGEGFGVTKARSLNELKSSVTDPIKNYGIWRQR